MMSEKNRDPINFVVVFCLFVCFCKGTTRFRGIAWHTRTTRATGTSWNSRTRESSRKFCSTLVGSGCFCQCHAIFQDCVTLEDCVAKQKNVFPVGSISFPADLFLMASRNFSDFRFAKYDLLAVLRKTTS